MERSVWWLKAAVIGLLCCVLFPVVASVTFGVLFVVGVAGGTVAFIVGVMCLLEWWFGRSRAEP